MPSFKRFRNAVTTVAGIESMPAFAKGAISPELPVPQRCHHAYRLEFGPRCSTRCPDLVAL